MRPTAGTAALMVLFGLLVVVAAFGFAAAWMGHKAEQLVTDAHRTVAPRLEEGP